MKKINFKNISLIYIVSFVSSPLGALCFDGSQVIPTGKIRNSNEVIYITCDNPYEFGYDDIVIKTEKTNKKGEVIIHFQLDKPSIIKLRAVSNKDGSFLQSGNLLLKSGDTIRINDDGNKLIVTFPQKNTERLNNFWHDYYKQPIKANSLREYREKSLGFFNNYFTNYTIDPFFERSIKSDLNYDWAANNVNYLLDKYYWNAKDSLKNLPADAMNFLKEITLNNPEAKSSNFYQNFINRYRLLLLEQSKHEQRTAGVKLKREIINKARFSTVKENLTGAARDIAIAYALQDIMSKNSEADLQLATTMIEDFKTFASDTGYLKPLREELNQRSALLPGKIAPDFAFTDVKGKKYKLSDFRGKAVYLGFIATWCPYSLEEEPALKALENKFKNNDIVFINASLEYKNEKKWKKHVRKHKVGGLHTYLEGQFQNDLVKTFFVKGTPNFVLIDKEGRIVSLTAKRPSEAAEVEITKASE